MTSPLALQKQKRLDLCRPVGNRSQRRVSIYPTRSFRR